MHLCIIYLFIYIRLSIDLAIHCSGYNTMQCVVFHGRINMLSNVFGACYYDSRRDKRINYVETLSGVFSNEKRPTVSFVGARVYDVAAVGIMRLTWDYTAVEILRGRVRTAAPRVFRTQPLVPRNLGAP